MATVPTPEEIARDILDIFVNHFKTRSGHNLSQMNFNAVWQPRNASDFALGMKYAIEKGWVTYNENNESYRLEQAGFDEA